MASNPDLVQYIVDQCSDAGEIIAKKMFGDYGLYCKDKIIGLICDSNLYIKPTEAGRALLRNEELRPPLPWRQTLFLHRRRRRPRLPRHAGESHLRGTTRPQAKEEEMKQDFIQ